MYLFFWFPNLENYDIYAFGSNKGYQLALNDYKNRKIPEKIKYFQNEKIINIAGGPETSGSFTFFYSGKNKFSIINFQK